MYLTEGSTAKNHLTEGNRASVYYVQKVEIYLTEGSIANVFYVKRYR